MMSILRFPGNLSERDIHLFLFAWTDSVQRLPVDKQSDYILYQTNEAPSAINRQPQGRIQHDPSNTY